MSQIEIQTADQPIAAYLAEPEGSGPAPGVVVVHEVFGMNDDIRRWCDRFADAGYLALAPDLYDRGWTTACVVRALLATRRGEGQAFVDIESAREHLVRHERCNGKVGIIGFCMGGGFALLMAPTGLFDAAAVNYGEVPEDAESLLDRSCPIVASYGEEDRLLSDDAERLERALQTNDVPHDFELYPEAGHGFLNDKESRVVDFIGGVAGVGYHEESARDAWERIRTLFDEHLR